jgi:hypothetical protein
MAWVLLKNFSRCFETVTVLQWFYGCNVTVAPIQFKSPTVDHKQRQNMIGLRNVFLDISQAVQKLCEESR